MATIRLDELMEQEGICESRSQAKMLIIEGKVLVDGVIITKPSKLLTRESRIEVSEPMRYVSRGGEKLHAFLEQFKISVNGKTALDVGASTGGFTDCLLQHGADSVVCIDVGHSQLHAKLLKDSRVINMEKVNARELTASSLPRAEFDIITVDLSFISLTKVLPAIWPLLKNEGILIALVKPQFEVGKAIVDKGKGIVTQKADREKALQSILDFSLELTNAELIGHMESPIIGGDGNHEYLMGINKTAD